LKDFIPNGQLAHRLWPVIDSGRFAPSTRKSLTRKKLGIDPDDFVLCYIGSVHGVNAQEVRYLYEAVALANEKGLSVKLIRTGRDTVDFLGNSAKELKRNVIELGYVDMEDVPVLMSMADLLVQPGSVDRFNRYRLPSKIPEFLATGKPVAVPKVNIGLSLTDGLNAFVMEDGNAEAIVKVIDKVKQNPDLGSQVGARGRQFARKNFQEKVIVKQLTAFYRRCRKK